MKKTLNEYTRITIEYDKSIKDIESLQAELRQAQEHCDNLHSQIRLETPNKRKNES